MAYIRYTTRAFVCGNEDRISSDRLFWLFTREAGMICARATSIRNERSKLRFALQDFSYSDVALVKGKYGWKIVGATPKENVYFASNSREARSSLRYVLTLVRRVAGSEEPQEGLFLLIEESITKLKEELSDRELVEDVLTLRILNMLGYVAPHEAYESVLSAKPIADVVVTPRQRKVIKGAIARALEASQL